MARRVARRTEHDHAAVTEHILVGHERLHLTLALHPILERLEVHAFRRFRTVDRVPVAFAYQQCRLRKRAHLAGVIGVIVADADIGNLLRLEIDLRQQIDEAHLRRDVGLIHGVAGVPQQILVAVLDEIAAVDELKLEVAIGIDVGKARVDGSRRLGRAAFEARERYVRRRLHRSREAHETTGTDCEYSEHSIHLIASLLHANPAASFSTISSILMNIIVGDKAANRSGRVYPQVTAPKEMPSGRAASRSLISSPM